MNKKKNIAKTQVAYLTPNVSTRLQVWCASCLSPSRHTPLIDTWIFTTFMLNVPLEEFDFYSPYVVMCPILYVSPSVYFFLQVLY